MKRVNVIGMGNEKQGQSAARRIYYTLHSGKNSKLSYYVASELRMMVPRWLLRPLLKGKLGAVDRQGIYPRESGLLLQAQSWR